MDNKASSPLVFGSEELWSQRFRQEIESLMKIMAFDVTKDYQDGHVENAHDAMACSHALVPWLQCQDVSGLRYGSLMIMTDQASNQL